MPRQFGSAPASRGPDTKLVIAGIGVLLIILIAVLAYLLLSRQGGGAPAIVQNTDDVNLISVVVPTRKIEVGKKLNSDMFKVELRSRFSVSDGVVTDINRVNGNYAKTLIVAEQPLYMDYLTKFRPDPITKEIPDGYRAVSIKVDDTSSVEGWATPGSIVDVLWITRIRGEDSLKVIVEKAKVLSAERSVKVDEDSKTGSVPSTVTLLVQAEDAKKIALAMLNGKLSLVLRNPDDETSDSGSAINKDIVAGGPRKQVKIERPKAQFTTNKLIIDGKKYCIFNGRRVEPSETIQCP